jgi:hypothetical protein
VVYKQIVDTEKTLANPDTGDTSVIDYVMALAALGLCLLFRSTENAKKAESK